MSFFIDLFLIFLVTFIAGDSNFYNPLFLSYTYVFWIVSAYFSNYYIVYRSTLVYRLLFLCVKQYILFFIAFFAYFGLFREGSLVDNQILILTSIVSALFLAKMGLYFALKAYRNLGSNYRKVVFIEPDENAAKIMKLFKRKKSLGYQYEGFFSDKHLDNNLGSISDSFNYILSSGIDEIYCSLSELDKKEVQNIMKFANTNNIVVKLIPDASELYSKSTTIEYYDNTLSVLKVRRLPFDRIESYVIKRSFDIIFSAFVCVLILTWVVPILWILIKIESKGPAIFKQQREGLYGEKFMCYKFRSMRLNKTSDSAHATEKDVRVTRIGRFIRKTSIDELPQFFNVLKGDMSVVGPRPHLEKLSVEYQKDVDDYLKRHVIKPGITGLAQVSGFRGEVKKKSDIINRIRLDIFYIENWSPLLDFKIVLQTVYNAIRGDKKAY